MPSHPLSIPHHPFLACSICNGTVDKVLGTEEEWVELGARPDRWWEKAWLSPEDARLWHDACMASMVAGYIPCMRPKVLRTLKVPDYSGTPCHVGFLCLLAAMVGCTALPAAGRLNARC